MNFKEMTQGNETDRPNHNRTEIGTNTIYFQKYEILKK